MATGQVNAVIPICSVQQGAFVVVNARNRRPLPVIQDARRVDKNIAMVIHDLAALEILDLHIVSAPRLVPSSAGDLVPRLYILMQTILARKIVEVGEYLS